MRRWTTRDRVGKLDGRLTKTRGGKKNKKAKKQKADVDQKYEDDGDLRDYRWCEDSHAQRMHDAAYVICAVGHGDAWPDGIVGPTVTA